MPLYEYECQSCHKRVEKIQSFSAEPLTVCPHCGGRLERLIAAPAIQFKGSGWYVSDYARGGSRKADGEPAAKGGEAKEGAAKADSGASKDGGATAASPTGGSGDAGSSGASSSASPAPAPSGPSAKSD